MRRRRWGQELVQFRKLGLGLVVQLFRGSDQYLDRIPQSGQVEQAIELLSRRVEDVLDSVAVNHCRWLCRIPAITDSLFEVVLQLDGVLGGIEGQNQAVGDSKSYTLSAGFQSDTVGVKCDLQSRPRILAASTCLWNPGSPYLIQNQLHPPRDQWHDIETGTDLSCQVKES